MIALDYANTRICAKRAQLLSRQAIEEMLDLNSTSFLVERLLAGPYQAHLSAAMAGHSETEALEIAFDSSLRDDLTSIKIMLGGAPLIDTMMEIWDARCLKTIIRGIHNEVPGPEICLNLTPSFSLDHAQLVELAGLPDIKALVEHLLSWSTHWGQVLKPLLSDYLANSDIRALDHAIDSHRFEQASESMRGEYGAAALSILMAEAEVTNIITCLMYIDHEQKPQLLPQGEGRTGVVAALHKTTDVTAAIDLLAESPYRRILDKALPLMTCPGKYAMFERLLDEQLLDQTRRIAAEDPVGIAVPFHYLRCKVNEIMNLRIIARGFEKHVPVNAIRAGLIFVKGN